MHTHLKVCYHVLSCRLKIPHKICIYNQRIHRGRAKGQPFVKQLASRRYSISWDEVKLFITYSLRFLFDNGIELYLHTPVCFFNKNTSMVGIYTSANVTQERLFQAMLQN